MPFLINFQTTFLVTQQKMVPALTVVFVFYSVAIVPKAVGNTVQLKARMIKTWLRDIDFGIHSYLTQKVSRKMPPSFSKNILSLSEKTSNFDLEHFKERNRFLAGPLNAALEKPISACIKKFDSVIIMVIIV